MKILLLSIFTFLSLHSMAQMGSGMIINDVNARYADSIKKSNWPYTFPLLGKKITKRGIDLQYPFGVMLNYLSGSQKILISDLQVGVNGGKLVPLDFVKFGEVKAELQTLNTRIDLWILPFVDIYGILGKTWAKTNVSLVSPVSFSTEANFAGDTYGAGVTLAGGFHQIFFSVDYNHTWSNLKGIQNVIHTQMLSPRIGYVFRFKKHPERNLTPWIGLNGIFINNTTHGSVSNLNVNGDAAIFQRIIDEKEPWYHSLTPAQQLVVKEIAKEIKNKIEHTDFEDITIDYSLKKQATSKWSMSFGGQFQFNKRWQFRTEAGFLGGRKTILTSLNYRFGF